MVICFILLIVILVVFCMYFKSCVYFVVCITRITNNNISSFVVAVYVQYHFQKQMAKHIYHISNSTFWYGDLA